MDYLTRVPDTFTLSGDDESRVRQLLVLTRQQVRLAQGPAFPHMQDALVDLEDAISDHLAALDTAADDDRTEAEEAGETERERRAYFPPRAA